MNNFKRTFLYIFIVLLIVSVYKDLTIGTQLNSTNNQQNAVNYKNEVNDMTVLRVKVQQGDTVLSIVEKINQHTTNTMNMKQVITDFKALNPTIKKPENLKLNTFYYFPVYEKEADI